MSSLIISCLFQSRLQPGKNKPASLAKAKHTRPNYQLPHCSFGLAGILPAFVSLPAPCLRAASFDSAPCSQAEQDPAGKLRKGYCPAAPPLWIAAVYLPAELPAGIHLCEELLCFGIRGKHLILCIRNTRVWGGKRRCVSVTADQVLQMGCWTQGRVAPALTVWCLSVLQPVPRLARVLTALGRAREDGWHCLHSHALPQLCWRRECVGAARRGPGLAARGRMVPSVTSQYHLGGG